MTLRTLKPKANNSLILDDEFLQYCKLNDIEDIEKFAREVFNQGFTILKYGKEPLTQNILQVETKKVDSSPSKIVLKPDDPPAVDAPIVVIPKAATKQMQQEQIQNMKKKADLYDE